MEVPPRPTITPLGRSTEDPSVWFEHKAQASLNVVVVGERRQEKATIRDVTFSGPSGERIAAYLVVPTFPGRYAGILYVHWLGDTTPNRRQFLEEAVTLAQQGAVSLLVDALVARPDPRKQWTGLDASADRQLVVQQVLELRQSLDLLLAQEGVDAERIGYVGHDLGGMFGAVLAGVDHRPRAFVFMATAPSFADWFLLDSSLEAEHQRAYRAEMMAVDPLRYLGRASPSSIFFQFANSDRYVSRSAAEAQVEAAGEPKRARWYESGHALHRDPVATLDRLEWLRQQLGMEKPAS